METSTKLSESAFQKALQKARQKQADIIKSRISRNFFTAVMGRNGSGKTTFIKNDIIPALEKGEIYGQEGNT